MVARPPPPASPSEVSTDQRPRCWRCGRVLARRLTRPWDLRCRRCKADNSGPE